MPREIIVDWQTASGQPGLSVFYFDLAQPVLNQRAALDTTLLANCEVALSTTTTWAIRREGRELDDNTGVLTGVWSEGTNRVGAGTNVATQAADSTQILLRWKTPTIVNGRFLQGRTFLPGVATEAIDGGNLKQVYINGLNAAANNYANSTTHPVVWHRPVLNAGGIASDITGGSVWSELAVLRRRRG